MELYFAPLACSLATRIALYEAGAPARFTQADTRTKTLETAATSSRSTRWDRCRRCVSTTAAS